MLTQRVRAMEFIYLLSNLSRQKRGCWITACASTCCGFVHLHPDRRPTTSRLGAASRPGGLPARAGRCAAPGYRVPVSMPALFYFTQLGSGDAGEAADGVVGQPLVVELHSALQPADELAHACMYAGIYLIFRHVIEKLKLKINGSRVPHRGRRHESGAKIG